MLDDETLQKTNNKYSGFTRFSEQRMLKCQLVDGAGRMLLR